MNRKTFTFLTFSLLLGLMLPAFAQTGPEAAVEDTDSQAVYYDTETGITDNEMEYMRLCREMLEEELKTLSPEDRMKKMEEIREKYQHKTGLIDWKTEYDRMKTDTE